MNSLRYIGHAFAQNLIGAVTLLAVAEAMQWAMVVYEVRTRK